MTATDELRRLLDELRKLACDINEEEINSHSVITLNQGRYNRQFRLDMNHDWLNAWHAELERILKAIAATLSDGTCLPHFWTHDGTLHVELPKLPESISVRLPDQRDREVGSARVWQFTLGAGTCHECAGMDDVFECSACGGRYEGWALKRWARYCPDCGAKVVEPTTNDVDAEVDDG